MSGDGREQRTSVVETSTPGRFMVVYDGGVIGHVERLRDRKPRQARARLRRERWAICGQPGEHARQGDAVAQLVRIHRGPR